jgi:hypothetical protein
MDRERSGEQVLVKPNVDTWSQSRRHLDSERSNKKTSSILYQGEIYKVEHSLITIYLPHIIRIEIIYHTDQEIAEGQYVSGIGQLDSEVTTYTCKQLGIAYFRILADSMTIYSKDLRFGCGPSLTFTKGLDHETL